MLAIHERSVIPLAHAPAGLPPNLLNLWAKIQAGPFARQADGNGQVLRESSPAAGQIGWEVVCATYRASAPREKDGKAARIPLRGQADLSTGPFKPVSECTERVVTQPSCQGYQL